MATTTSKASFMDKLDAQAYRAGITKGTPEAAAWFKNKLKTIKSVNRRELLRDEQFKTRSKPLAGRLFMYFYNPKTKKTLPYYDKFPLTIMLEKASGGFYGLNLHYLPPKLRAKMFDGLQSFMNNDKYDQTTKFRLTYNLVNSAAKLKYYKPCFKHYLTKNITSQLVEVPASEWESVMFLPTESFSKANKNQVWKDSKSLI